MIALAACDTRNKPSARSVPPGGRSISVLCVLPKHERRVRLPPPAPESNQPPNNQMKKTIIALAISSLIGAGALFAADTKTEAKVANCCVTAQKAGNACAHACCVESAKAGNNCT